MEREREPVEKAPPEKEVEVRGSPTRCPYCHDECTAAQPHSVCEACLARHHESCWDSHGSCATCSSTRRLAPVPRPALTVDQARATLVKAGYTEAEIDAVFARGESGRAIVLRLGIVVTSLAATIPFVLTDSEQVGHDQLARLAVLAGVLSPVLGIVSGSWTRSVVWGLLAPTIFFVAGLLGARLFTTPFGVGVLLLGVVVGMLAAMMSRERS
jgi:hypothetical protein